MKAEPILIKGLQKVEEEIHPLFHNLMVEENPIKRKEIWEQIQHKWREECRYIGDEIIKETNNKEQSK
jgi:hypothetical protein